MAEWGQGIVKDIGLISISKPKQLLEELEAKGLEDAVIHESNIMISAESNEPSTMDGDDFFTIGCINIIKERLEFFNSFHPENFKNSKGKT